MRRDSFPNMITYANLEMATFDEVPLGEIDSLILTWLVYLHFLQEPAIMDDPEGVNIRDLYRAEDFDKLLVDVWSREDTMELFRACIASPRYRNMRLIHYRSETNQAENKQFAAVTFRLTEDSYYVSFRGTDWSLAGWEEDFRMALEDPVPSQLLALDYLKEIAEKYPGKLYVGGHSKGGNLAVYSAAMAPEEIQDRIETVYSHDGPGFLETDLAHEGFQKIRHKIEKTVPEFSVFGILMEQEAEYQVVCSHEIGIMQHNPLSWEIVGSQLLKENKLSISANFIHGKLEKWLQELDYEKREKFIRNLFEVIGAPGEEGFEELRKDFTKNGRIILRKIRSMDAEENIFMLQTIQMLLFGNISFDREAILRRLHIGNDSKEKDEEV